MSTDIHDKIRSEVERRLAIARAADGHELFDGTGIVSMTSPNHPKRTVALPSHIATFAALHDPADAIRRYAHALKILEDHHPVARDGSPAWASSDGRAWCWTCTGLEGAGKFLIAAPSPCPPITDLAESLGIDTGGTDG